MHFFLAFRSFDQWHRDVFPSRPKKWHQHFYTQDLHTMKIFKIFKLEFLLESLAIRAPPAPLLHFYCLVSFAEQSKETLPPCIHLERIAASGRIIPTKEGSIGSLMNLAAK